MGENTNAAKYAELAKSVDSGEPKSASQPQRVGRTQQGQMRNSSR
jgi:hypothetical protein